MRNWGWPKILFFGIAAGASAVLGVWVGDRNPATETKSAVADPEVVRAGTELRIVYDFQRYRLCPRETERTIFDGLGVRFDLGKLERPFAGPPGRDGYVQPVLVPLGAAPGRSLYRVMVLDYCNPTHRLWPMRKVIDVPFIIAEPLNLPREARP